MGVGQEKRTAGSGQLTVGKRSCRKARHLRMSPESMEAVESLESEGLSDRRPLERILRS